MTDLKILDFDIENRPLAYLGPDYTTAEVTAIAACWHNQPRTMRVWLLGRDDPRVMLQEFRKLYEEADIVTGHYIRGHDLPVLNGAMLEQGMPPLGPKLTIDTKLDLVSVRYISMSQENLSEMFGIIQPKAHMSNAMWRESNRLTPKGLALTYKRVIGDVIQHMRLREKLTEQNMLKAPKVWSGAGHTEAYVP